MRFGSCQYERELSAALHSGHWPDGCSAELRGHVASCSSCSERLLVTQAFRRERAITAGAAHLESPGAIWWRAQLRRRNAAIQRISRPIFGAQIFAVVIAVVATAVFFASQAKQSAGWLAWLAEIPRSLHLNALLPATLENGVGGGLLAAGAALLCIAGGVFVYIASDRQ